MLPLPRVPSSLPSRDALIDLGLSVVVGPGHRDPRRICHVPRCQAPLACRFLQNGAAVTGLLTTLGRANLATTQVYARMVDERMRASIRALDYGIGTKENAEPARVNAAR